LSATVRHLPLWSLWLGWWSSCETGQGEGILGSGVKTGDIAENDRSGLAADRLRDIRRGRWIDHSDTGSPEAKRICDVVDLAPTASVDHDDCAPGELGGHRCPSLH
jgi:hypothetical protein